MAADPNPPTEPEFTRRAHGAGVDAADLGLWSWDMHTGEAWFSAAFRNRLGYQSHDFAGRIDSLRHAIHPEDLPRFDAAAAVLRNDGAPVDIEIRVRRSGGSWAPCRIRAEADPEGVQRAHGALLDAGTRARTVSSTDRARPARAARIAAALDEASRSAAEFAAAKRELERQNLELQRSRADAVASAIAKTAFLANMSHEIRTPMTAVLGFADLLGDASISAEEQQSLIVGIRRNGEHLLKIISDILDLSKIEAGGMSVEPMTCRHQTVVEEVAALMAPRARQHGVAITVSVAPGTPAEIRTDPTRLRQILLNLCSNAVKFTQRGTVSIEVSTVPTDEPPAPRRDPEATDAPIALRRIRFRVRDTGIGMSEAQIARLFKPFAQGDATMSRRFGGTGLGLAISRRLARMLGGDIVATSAPAQGSSFAAEIAIDAADIGYGPSAAAMRMEQEQEQVQEQGQGQEQDQEPDQVRDRAQAPGEREAGRGDHSGQAGNGMQAGAASGAGATGAPLKLLLAEDGIDNQRLILFHLRRHHATAQVVENGRDALAAVEAAAARGEPFDAILLDMQMPLMDGYEVARRLRAARVRTPIAALTADVMAGDRERCLAAGCDEYLSKPIDSAAIGAFLAKVARARTV